MSVVEQLKEFIVSQDVIPKSIKIHPLLLTELENEKFVYMIPDQSVKRFMGIELIPSEDINGFESVEKDTSSERWIVKREFKKIKEKHLQQSEELSKDIQLLFSYIGYLERELEDKSNYLKYINEKQTIQSSVDNRRK